MLPITDDCFKLVVRKVDIDARGKNYEVHRGAYYISKRLLPIVVSVHHPKGINYWLDQLKNCTVTKTLSTSLVEYYAYHGFEINPYYVRGSKIYDLFPKQEEYTALLHRIAQSRFNQPTPNYLVIELFRQGMADTLDQLFSKGKASKEKIDNEGPREAIANGHLECIKVYLRHACTAKYEPISLANYAITSEKADILEYLLDNPSENFKTEVSHIMYSFCSSSRFRQGCLEVARKFGTVFTKEDLNRAVSNGNIGMVEYMLNKANVKDSDKHLPLDVDELPKLAAKEGHFEVLKLLLENGCKISRGVLDAALRSRDSYNKENILRFVLKQNCSFDRTMLCYAARNLTVDQFKILVDSDKWETGFSRYTDVSAHAAMREDTDMLEYLHSIDMEWDDSTCHEAVEYGRLANLKFAHDNGCSWGYNICEIAVEYNQLSCLKYLIENGCTINRWELMQQAANSKSKAIFKYLGRNTQDLYKDAMGDYHDDISDDDNNSDSE